MLRKNFIRYFHPTLRAWFLGCVCLLLAAMLTLQLSSAWTESQTVDEGAHLASGYSYWKTNDFRLNPEHPPLVKLLASVPLLFLPIHIPTDTPAWTDSNEWAFAHALLYENTVSADVILRWGRLSPMLLGLALGLLVALWAKKMWGVAGALFSLALYVFDPTVLAHSRYVTTDIGVSLFFVLTIYLFGKYCDNPRWRNWIPFAVSFALAQVSKFSAVLLVPILLLLWIAKYLTVHPSLRPLFSLRRFFAFAGATLGISMVIVFCVYGFELRKPISDPQLASVYVTHELWDPQKYTDLPAPAQAVRHWSDPETKSGKAIQSFFTNVPIPAYSFYRGLSDVLWHNYWGHDSYLLGHHAPGNKGWWYYFPVVFFIKTPFATILLLLLTVLYFFRLAVERWETYHQHISGTRPDRIHAFFRGVDFEYILLTVPPAYYFLTSLTSHINLGVRHLLPVYPFLFILVGSLTKIRFQRWTRAWQTVLGAMLALNITSSVLVFPHFLSYFSDVVGGPDNGARYVTDSNLDWGQELKRLATYLDDHNIPFVYMTYFGQAPMSYYLKDVRYLPSSDQPENIAQLDGWVAISATALYSYGDAYSWLRELHPTAKVGYAIFLYDLRKTSHVSVGE